MDRSNQEIIARINTATDEEEEMRSYQSGWRRGFTLDNGYSLDGIMEWDLPAWSWSSLRSRAENEPSQSLKFHNHGDGPYLDLLLVESTF